MPKEIKSVLPKPYNYAGQMFAWEDGRLTDEETVVLFQYLVDTGMAWTLQGMYGRQAQALIEVGLVHLPQQSGSVRRRNPHHISD